MSDERTIIKRSLLGFNILFFISGLALIIFGITLPTPFGDYFTVKPNAFSEKYGMRIGLIFLLLIVSGVYFYAVAKENNRLLTVVAILYIILFVTEFTLGLIYFTLRSEAALNTKKFGAGAMLLNQYGTDPKMTEAMDTIQRTFACCGVMDFRDWFISPWDKKQGVSNRVPMSCCKVPAPTCGFDMDIKNPIDVINIQGCVGLSYFYNDRQKIIGGVGLGLAFLHIITILLCIIFGFCYNSASGLSTVDALKGEEPQPSSNSSAGSSRQRKKSVPAYQEQTEEDDDEEEEGLALNPTKDLLDKSKD